MRRKVKEVQELDLIHCATKIVWCLLTDINIILVHQS
jgi:hypothetical protein